MPRDVKVAIVGDTRGLRTALAKAETQTKGFAASMKTMGTQVRSSINMWAPIAGAALAGLGVHAIKVASDIDEATSKVENLFGDNAKAIKAWSEQSAEAMGMSKREYLEATGLLGNLMVGFGSTQKEAAFMSARMTTLAADLASFNNTSVDEAVQALGAAMSGETEPMKKYGVALNDAALKQMAMEMGLYSGKGTLDAYAKSQAAYALILENTTAAQGDFARTADGMANSTKIAKAKFEDLMGALGEQLMPVANVVLEGLIAGLDWLSNWWDENGEQITTDFKNGLTVITDWWETDGQVWLADFKRGWHDLQDGVRELRAVWDEYYGYFQIGWHNFMFGIEEFKDRWSNAVENFKAGWRDFTAGLAMFADMFRQLWDVIWEIGEAVVAFGQFAYNTYSSIHRVINGFLDGLLDKAKQLIDIVVSLPGRIKDAGFGALPGGGLISAALDLFDTGGVVPGLRGEARLAVVHGGETILPTHKDPDAGRDRIGAGSGGQPIIINIAGHKVAEVLGPALRADRRMTAGTAGRY